MGRIADDGQTVPFSRDALRALLEREKRAAFASSSGGEFVTLSSEELIDESDDGNDESIVVDFS